MNNNQSNASSKLWMRLTTFLFFIAVIALLSVYVYLFFMTAQIRSVVSSKEQEVARMLHVKQESIGLTKEIETRKANEVLQKQRLKMNLYATKDLKSFPVKNGNHFVIQLLDSGHRRGMRLYVPPGQHFLNFDIGRVTMDSHDDHSDDGKHIVETIQLPSASVCEFTLELKALEDRFVSTVTLVNDRGDSLYEKHAEFPRPDNEGGTTAGDVATMPRELVFRPGQFGPTRSKPWFQLSHRDQHRIHDFAFKTKRLIHVKRNGKTGSAFSFQYDIDSPGELPFLHATDANIIPEFLRLYGLSFDDVFLPLKNDRFELTPQGSRLFLGR